MIDSFKKESIKDLANILRYHEDKVDKDKAVFLGDNFFADTAQERLTFLRGVLEQNKRVTKNHIFNVSLNLPHGENLKDEEFLNVAQDYLKKMGYGNSPALIYRHNDAKQEHLHIIAATVDFSGKKVNDWNDYRKGQRTCLELEKTYGLEKTVYYNKTTMKNLGELNAEKYEYHKFVLKQRSIPENVLDQFFSESAITKLAHSYFSNEEVLSLLKEGVSEDDFRYFKSDYEDNIVLQKQELRERVLKLYEKAESFGEFQNFFTGDSDLYGRVIMGKKPYMVFGIVGQNDVGSVYVQDKKLDYKLRYENLLLIGKEAPLKEFSLEKQKSFLRFNIRRALAVSPSYEVFVRNLSDRGIDLIEHTNSGGVYGLSFKSTNIKNPFLLKGSEIDRGLSLKNIEKRIAWNAHLKDIELKGGDEEKREYLKSIGEYHPSVERGDYSYIPTAGSIAPPRDIEPEQQWKKWRRKRKEQEFKEKTR